ncbi:MAG: nitroreductase family protein [Armatimonadetes bacterium]|nr:nitroreductase family protein [Armatimonadota bacterium]
MDAYLAVVSKREVRQYTTEPIPEATLTRILQAGRATGSSRNRQPWAFVVVTDKSHLAALSRHAYSPGNLTGCAAAVVVAVEGDRDRFDAGRVAQNMMLAAWALGIGSCPNGFTDEGAAGAALGLPAGMRLPTVLTLGRPAPGAPRPRPGADPERVLGRVKRKPLEAVVHREQYRPPASA